MLNISNLYTSFEIPSKKIFQKKKIKAVENVSIEIPEGKTVGLVGESGCGKSTLGRSILKLIQTDSGSIKYKDQELSHLSQKDFLPYRKELQIIFQDPYSSLNPRMTIQQILTEGLILHEKFTKKEIEEKTFDIIERMSLKKEILYRYPHEFSGGQRQRVAIARTLILRPSFVVCDEVVSALDVSTQAQVINLLTNYKDSNNLSLLFISHDLSVISYMSDYIAVMYLGKIVEYGTKNQIISNPLHPYTQALFASGFSIENRNKKRFVLSGEVPSVLDKPNGCYFHTRCPKVTELCKQEIPIWKKANSGSYLSCHNVF